MGDKGEVGVEGCERFGSEPARLRRCSITARAPIQPLIFCTLFPLLLLIITCNILETNLHTQ